jgi:hypothetical protein
VTGECRLPTFAPPRPSPARQEFSALSCSDLPYVPTVLGMLVFVASWI